MASAGRRQIFGGSTSITKSRRWRPQINGGGSAGARLYLKNCHPIRLLFLLLPFSSSSSFFSSSSSPFSPLILLFFLLIFSSSSPPPLKASYSLFLFLLFFS